LTSIGIVSLGYSTTEALPLYHYLPGGSLLRVIVLSEPPSSASLSGCEHFDVINDVYVTSLTGPSLKQATPQQLAELARAWDVDGIVLEGYAISHVEGFIAELKGLGIRVGVRTNMGKAPKNADFLLLDALGTCSESQEVPGIEVHRLLRDLRSAGSWVEVAGYLKEPVPERVLGLASVTADNEVPLHLFLLEHKGGGPVRDTYNRLRQVNPFTYIHVSLYSELTTYCPHCGSPIAYREENVLKDLALGPSNKCWRCGYPLPFTHVVAKKTPDRVIRLSGRGTRWYDPRAVMRI